MHRFYADPELSSAESVRLSAKDSHHALSVLRLKCGDSVEIVEDGKRCCAVIESTEGGDVRLVRGAILPSTEPAISFTLYQGVPKGDKMEWIVQKAVELGVSRIVPVAMSRCVSKLNDRDGLRKRERWQKIAREAGKQCGRCIIPEVSAPVHVSDLPGLDHLPEYLVIPWEEASHYGPLAFFRDHPSVRSFGIVIGPEGGIAPDEIRFLSACPASAVITLGPRILRTETAGLAAVSAFSALYGEME